MNQFQYKLYPILDCPKDDNRQNSACISQNSEFFLPDILEDWSASPQIIPFIQLRLKNHTDAEIEKIYRHLSTNHPSLKIIINDYWRLAEKLGAFGFHLGKEDYAELTHAEKIELSRSKLFKGTSSHSAEDIRNLEPFWDYSGIGPVFGTNSKQTPYPTLGISQLGDIISLSKTPLVAIGGIGPDNYMELLTATGITIAAIASLSDKNSFYKMKEILESFTGSK